MMLAQTQLSPHPIIHLELERGRLSQNPVLLDTMGPVHLGPLQGTGAFFPGIIWQCRHLKCHLRLRLLHELLFDVDSIIDHNLTQDWSLLMVSYNPKPGDFVAFILAWTWRYLFFTFSWFNLLDCGSKFWNFAISGCCLHYQSLQNIYFPVFGNDVLIPGFVEEGKIPLKWHRCFRVSQRSISLTLSFIPKLCTLARRIALKITHRVLRII